MATPTILVSKAMRNVPKYNDVMMTARRHPRKNWDSGGDGPWCSAAASIATISDFSEDMPGGRMEG